MIAAGTRILESACGFCVGAGQAPQSGEISVRTSNRNYKGRSGTADANLYLTSPETAVAIADDHQGRRALELHPDRRQGVVEAVEEYTLTLV